MNDYDNEQKMLKEFVKRRHPEYEKKLTHWDFVKSCYDGGREWFVDNIFQYLKEGEKEYSDRLKRCYRFNHTREVVDLVDKYIFKMEIARNEDDAPEPLKRFWQRATKSGLTITELAKQVSKATSIYGRVWIVVDNNKPDGVLTLAEEKETDSSVYAYIVTPQNMCDVSYDENGRLNWILIHEKVRDDADPFYSDGEQVDRYRLWTRNDWTLFTIVKDKRGVTGSDSEAVYQSEDRWRVEMEGPYEHGLGVVPVFSADNTITNDELYSAPSLIDDVAYLDRAIANYLSNLDAIIQDQTFSQLTIPIQAIPEDGAKMDDKVKEVGTARIFTYDGSGGEPKFISPDVKQAQILLDVISKNINEIYQTVGLAGERTKEDNALGIDNSSGVAKAYDFERVNSLLAAKADSLEIIENKLSEFVMLWSGEELEPDERYVAYPDNFDVRGLYDEFEIAARLSLINAPDEIRKSQMESVVKKLFPQSSKSKYDKLIKSIQDWEFSPISNFNQGDNDMVGSTGSQKVGGQQDNRVDDSQKGNRKEPKTDTQLRSR